jgi:hypothetical protein
MVRIINGRGQLGEKLQRYASIKGLLDVAIYHTWQVTYSGDSNMSEEMIQLNEYNKLVEFSKNNPNTKIIFISTTSQRSSWYTYYKEQAEAYLLANHDSCIILKFPAFIGKGILPKLKSGEINPYGTIELITLDKAAETVEEYIYYNGLKRVFTIEGEKIEAKTLVEILKV